MAAELALLGGAVDQLLALDPQVLDDDGLHELVVGLGAMSSQLEAAWVGLIREWDRRLVWAADGSKAPAARLARETRMRQSDAKALVRRGRDLQSMPITSAAYRAGELTGAHVDLIASCDRLWRNASFADSERLLVDNCMTAWFANAVAATRYWQMLADRDAAECGHDPKRDRRRLSASTGWEGEVKLDGVLDPISGEIVTTELGRLYEQMRLSDLRDGVERTPAQRRADALVEMAMRSATAPADGLRPKPLITVTMGIDHFQWMCQTAAGTVIAPGTVLPLLTDAEIERIVYDPPNRRIEASYRRQFPSVMAKIIRLRDQTCQHPGCNEPAVVCDIDHVVPRSQGGITCLCNGQLLCAYHNRIWKAGADGSGAVTPMTRRQRTGDPLPAERDERQPWCNLDHDDSDEASPRAPPEAG